MIEESAIDGTTAGPDERPTFNVFVSRNTIEIFKSEVKHI